MRKSQLVELIQTTMETTTKKEAEMLVNIIENKIKEELLETGESKLLNLGSLKVRERKERQGRNPKTGEEITIAASKTVAFKPGKALKEDINA